jgi:hypothetical protein
VRKKGRFANYALKKPNRCRKIIKKGWMNVNEQKAEYFKDENGKKGSGS